MKPPAAAPPTQAPAQHRDELAPVVLPAPLADDQPWIAHVYAHSHWDREWYRTYERFRMQLMTIVDRVIQVLDSQPEFTAFVLDGQTIVLEDYLRLRPEAEADLRRLVQARRIEIGPWYVLPDEFLVSGESLVRNLEIGRHVAERFGPPLAVGYLPDPFGHVAQLPAILRGFGIDNVIFSRGMGDEWLATGNAFRWQAPGGDDVLALVQTSPYTSGYCNAEVLGRGHLIDDAATYEPVQRLAEYHAQHASIGSMLWAAGCDHETIIDDLPAKVAHLGSLCGVSDVRLSGLDAFVEQARREEQAREASGHPLARHSGELRGSLHAPILASIFSARIELKQANAQLQALLEQTVEPLIARAVAAGLRPLVDVIPILRHAWSVLLENHAHDSIGGCSIDEVHREMPARFLRVLALAMGLIEDVIIALDLQHEALVIDGSGRGGIALRADRTPVAIAPLPAAVPVPLCEHELLTHASSHTLNATDTAIDNGVLRVEAREQRLTITMRDQHGAVAAQLVDAFTFVDEADAGDEYDFGLLTADAPRAARITAVSTCEPAPGIVEMVVRHELDIPIALTHDRTARSEETVTTAIDTTLRLTPEAEHVDATSRWVNASCDHRLRLQTGVVDDVSETIADGHFALAARPVTPEFPAVTWRQQPPGIGAMEHLALLRSAAVEGSGGVAVFARGLHELQARSEPARAGAARLEVTVLRSVGWLSRDDIAGRPGDAGPQIATPDAQCLGERQIEWALTLVHAQSDDELAAQARAWACRPIIIEPMHDDPLSQSGHSARMRDVARARDARSIDPALDAAARLEALAAALPICRGDGVTFTSTRPASDESGDVIVRCWSHAGGVAILDGAALTSSLICRLVRLDGHDEHRGEPSRLEPGERWSTPVAAGAIVTIRLSAA